MGICRGTFIRIRITLPFSSSRIPDSGPFSTLLQQVPLRGTSRDSYRAHHV